MKENEKARELREQLAHKLTEDILALGYAEISKEKAEEVAIRYYSSETVLAHGSGNIAELLAEGIIASFQK